MNIQEIKQQLTLSSVLQHYGLKPDKHLRLHCPFHDDKTPSLQVYYKTHTCYCFSSNCKTHGKALDVIDFVMHKESCSKHEAIQKCKQLIGGSVYQTYVPSPPGISILGNMFIYFRNAVHHSKPAQEYIRSRGLDATLLEIGYNTAQFHHGNRKDESLIRPCVEVGLLSPWGTNTREGGQAYKPFAKYCIVFALRDSSDQVSGLYFRSTINDDEQKHFYLKDRRGLYPGYPKPDKQRLILTEAIIDAATLLQQSAIAKNYSVLSCYGTNGFTKEHQEAIKSLPALQEIIFAFDGDEAGSKAVAKYAVQLREQLPHIVITTLNLPAGEDINSMALSHERDIFVHLLSERKEFFLSSEKTIPEPLTVAAEKSPLPGGLDTANPYKLCYSTEHIFYYVQGGISKQLDSMKVTLVVERKDNSQKSRNKLDLYEDKQLDKLSREVSEKLLLDKALLEADLYRLVDMLDEYREKDLVKPGGDNGSVMDVYPLTLQERTAAETFLKEGDLITRLNDLLGQAGIVGEETNRLFLLLIAISYKMPETLHALIQGSSGSGKTRLLKQISDCIPQEKVTKLTRVSDKVLYNYPEHYFVNRLLCLEDIDGLSEEAEFAFRELQSNGELNSATSIKLDNGQITSGQKTVKGPIASLACTTRGEIYEDNMSRVFLLAVDESADQTSRIINYQNNKASGQIDSKQEQDTKHFIQNLVRCLQSCQVINPYASKLQLPQDAHKIRRLNDLFLNFVKMVTLVHQYQRKKDSKGRLITEISDLETAVDIMFDSIVLKVDELDGSLRQFYEQLKGWLQQQHGDKYQNAVFGLREIRQSLKFSKTQVFRYASDLTRLEYMQVCGGHINRGFTYKLSYCDNYQLLRERISNYLASQIQSIKVSANIGTLESLPVLK
ncbi:toprim domain-containing protein [Chitinophaga ginsengisegetis]|uniref:CHC2 zinc finger domain-containing protein n=1 Tax=Chitinophaga ginsengisegetis TaxID=393003 RepID=UPI000DB962C5|nr:CHC2 zinc finger domain-containing protein [Chitinophaga ginsengisegetis]MDR6571343.1 DNA primase/energy-coupling factor transporter ATP-binding protein EcfA2 [Chitinophaga ginsengisegetis]MDR6651077.1 DNA primase/energy-coupling factor transporter ATP-binding protein EcfA2 [Chitinophaga ginsengisegetis]MDR6657427.1 DNA primase/energy-coupling factor transporter ATP-binding protein EcfA2 [Chitinophaga ginsengisegetis]